MASTQYRNEYLDRVVAQQQVLAENLKSKRSAAPAQPARGRAAAPPPAGRPRPAGVEVRDARAPGAG